LTGVIKPLKQRWRRWQLSRRGIRVEWERPLEAFGSGSGAWTIDPSGLNAASIVYSFGVGRDVSFDLALIERFGMTVHAFDPTPEALAWVAGQQLPSRFVVHDYGVAGCDGELEFTRSRRSGSAHYSPVRRYRNSTPREQTVRAPVRRLASIMRALGHARVDLLKMDIEGGEYDVIADLAREPLPIGQLALEFHHAYETVPLARTVAALELLARLGFRLIHVSPRSYEMTLLHAAGPAGAAPGPSAHAREGQ
jgi:FkbM family methyltransferase